MEKISSQLSIDEIYLSVIFIVIGIILTELFHFFKSRWWESPRRRLKIENNLREAYELIDRGNSSLSLKKLDETLTLFDEHEYPDLRGIALRGKGKNYLSLFPHAKNQTMIELSIKYLEEAIQIIKDNEKNEIVFDHRYPQKNILPSLQLARTKADLALSISDLSDICNQKENLDRAVSVCKQALNSYKSMKKSILSENNDKKIKELDKDIADSYHNLGAYHAKLSDIADTEANLCVALKYFEQSLEYYLKTDNRKNIIIARHNIGINLRKLSKISDKRDNLSKSLQQNVKALEAFDMYKDDKSFYPVLNDTLANTYKDHAVLEKSEDYINKAIQYHVEALTNTPSENNVELQRLNCNLAADYLVLADFRDKSVNIHKAITLFKDALKVQIIIKYPIDYARTHFSLGKAYGKLGTSENSLDNYTNSINCLLEAFKIYQPDSHKYRYIQLCNEISAVYFNLSKISDRDENLGKCFKYSNQAKSLCNPSDIDEYTKSLFNLGIAHAHLAQDRDKQVNLDKAKYNFEQVINLLKNDKNEIYQAAVEYLNVLKSIQ